MDTVLSLIRAPDVMQGGGRRFWCERVVLGWYRRVWEITFSPEGGMALYQV